MLQDNVDSPAARHARHPAAADALPADVGRVPAAGADAAAARAPPPLPRRLPPHRLQAQPVGPTPARFHWTL